jgi:hypothetical protein
VTGLTFGGDPECHVIRIGCRVELLLVAAYAPSGSSGKDPIDVTRCTGCRQMGPGERERGQRMIEPAAPSDGRSVVTLRTVGAEP